MHSTKRILCVVALTIGAATVHAQDKAKDTGLVKISLDDLSPFKPQAGNWMIVGDVTIDPETDIHAHHEAAKAEEPKKKKKSKVAEPVVAAPEAVTFESGKGILLNMNSESKKDNLITAFEHGDIELELEVMIPKGSNSGIYLQGRYEVQLLDSWGVRNPKFSDIGGIYRNWESEPDKIYMGAAPIANPAKAAGLWQKMKISFRAPKFDASGKKIANARFESIDLNGVRIHDNLEVPLPTGGPIDGKEVAMGPLMIQGDHGPVAFRNIQYRLMHDVKTSIGPVTYKIYHGNYKVIADFASAKPDLIGSGPSLSAEVIDIDDAYGIVYDGTITVPQADTYTFTLGYTGGVKFVLDGKTLLDLQRPDDWRYSNATVDLAAGTYHYEIDNYKGAAWMPPRLGLQVRTATSYPQTLSAFNSYPPDDNPTSAILIKATNEPKLLRAFVDFKRDRRQRLTHTIGVAEPANINYVYDLDAGNLVCVWRGDFVDATPMWHDRGDGSFRPLGAIQWLFSAQPLAFLSAPTDAFPATGKEGDFRTKGYTIDEVSKNPAFMYSYAGLDVTDKVSPTDEDRSISHEITLKERGTKPGLTYKIAEGNAITKMANGSWSVDKQFYIKIKSSAAPVVRTSGDKKELIVPFDGTTLQYTIIW